MKFKFLQLTLLKKYCLYKIIVFNSVSLLRRKYKQYKKFILLIEMITQFHLQKLIYICLIKY